jgi:MFS family permease
MSKRATGVLLAIFCTIFITYAVRYTYGVFLPEMLTSLQISKTESGVIYSAYFVAYTVLSPVLGMLGDRFNTRFLISVFTAVAGVGTFLMSYSSSVFGASAYFTLVGIGASAGWAPAVALAQRWVSDKRRGLVVAVVDAGSALGIIWGGTIVPLIVVSYGWRTGWQSLGIFCLLLALLNYLLLRDAPSPKKIPVAANMPFARRSLRATYATLLRDGKFWLLGLAYLLTGFSIIIPFTFLNTYAVQELSIPYEISSKLIIVIGGTAFVAKLILGPVSDKVGRIRIMMLCAILIAAGSSGMRYATTFYMMILPLIVFGIGYGSVWALYAASATDYFSKEIAGSIIGLWTLYLGAGSTISPILAGWIADTTGTLSWSFFLAVGGGVLSFILLLPVCKSHRHPV